MDGLETTSYKSSYESYPFFTLDLGSSLTVRAVTVRVPPTSGVDLPFDLEARVSDEGDFRRDRLLTDLNGTLCVNFAVTSIGTDIEMECDAPQTGRFVALQRMNCGQLEIGELTVWGEIEQEMQTTTVFLRIKSFFSGRYVGRLH